MSEQFGIPRLFVASLFLSGLAVTASAQEPPEKTALEHFTAKHHIGVRLGIWSNQGGSPTDTTSGSTTIDTEIDDENLYLEAYFAYHFMPAFMGEVSAGTVDRGSVAISQAGTSDIGNLNVFPILLKLKAYPLIGTGFSFQPFVSVGGGIYYGRRNVQFTTSAVFFGFNEETETDFNYTLAAGVDYPISSVIALESQVSYMPIDFSNPLVGVTDYEALSITVGIKYLYGKN